MGLSCLKWAPIFSKWVCCARGGSALFYVGLPCLKWVYLVSNGSVLSEVGIYFPSGYVLSKVGIFLLSGSVVPAVGLSCLMWVCPVLGGYVLS